MGAGAVAMPSLLNGFSVRASKPSFFEQMLHPNLVGNDRILVIVNLNGGNDGLNTLVPVDQYDLYKIARPKIGIPQDKLLSLSGVSHVGMNPAMTGIRELYDDGKVAIIQNVGYPEPSFSHFRSNDIWTTASDSDEILKTGWVGRYLKYEYPNYPFDFPNAEMPDPLAIEIGYAQSVIMQGPAYSMGIAVADPTSFFNLVNGIDTPTPNTPAGEQLKYVRLIARQANLYAGRIQEAFNSVATQPAYPDTVLAAQLKIVAKLIAGGLKTRIYHVWMTGFDTHDSQAEVDAPWVGRHAKLLKEFSDAVKIFQDDLTSHGVQDKVLGMTYSEFGRRIISNGSDGTDHGAAAPVFIFGSNVQPGILGDNPTLPAAPTVDDNIPMQHDFRSVYRTLLEGWFCMPPADVPEILLDDFPGLPFIQPAASCLQISDARERNKNAGRRLLDNYPNPFWANTTIRFEGDGGRATVQILDGAGKLVATPFSDASQVGRNTISWDSEGLPTGIYYCRLQNGAVQQVGQMLKVAD